MIAAGIAMFLFGALGVYMGVKEGSEEPAFCMLAVYAMPVLVAGLILITNGVLNG